jgi:hypothetical protein
MVSHDNKNNYRTPFATLHSFPELEKEVRANEPVKKQATIEFKKDRVKVNILHNNVDEKVIIKEIIEYMDCSGSAYIRDKKHKPLKVYFDYKTRNERERKEINKIKEILSKDLSEVINYLKEGNELCIVLGHIDVYVYKTPETNTYNMTEINY